ncbi:hypothetical protein ACFORG_18370 [Lutimaribacter marinistellae]|uniref:FG-GAP repeat-containing protein n=1 Tax=Lutimaribacter marinistellae TaxID=1820329 RepID=A0ABV7TLS1_9RHOB
MARDLTEFGTTATPFGFTIDGDLNSLGDGAGLGIGVSVIGDFNGDGVDDFMVSASGHDFFDANRKEAGGVYVVYGGTALANQFADGRLDLTPGALSFEGEIAGNGLLVIGERSDDILAGKPAGDVNGDGFDDVFLTAPSFVEVENPANPFETFDHRPGTGYILYGGPGAEDLTGEGNSIIDLAALPGNRQDGNPGVTVIHAEADTLRTGLSFAGGGDLNGDGLADVALGTFQAAGILYNPDGSVFVPPTLPNIPGLPNLTPVAADGRVYAIYGGSAMPAEIDLTGDIVQGNGSKGFFTQGFIETVADADGDSMPDFVGSIGLFGTIAMADLDGNGRDELILGSPFGGELQGPAGSEAQYTPGGLFVLTVGQGETPTEITLRDQVFLQGEASGELSATGIRVETLGDINGDGIEDLGIRAPLLDSDAGTNTGAVYGLLGDTDLFGAGQLTGRGTLAGAAAFRILGKSAGDGADVALDDENDTTGEGLLVSDLSKAGDLNGDGVDDFVVGFSNAGSSDGAVYVVLGRTGADEGPTSDLLNFDQIVRFDDYPGAGQEQYGMIRLDGADGASQLAGASLSGPIDLNGDGEPDLLIGAPGPLELQPDGDQLPTTDGRVYVVSQLFEESGLLVEGTPGNDRLVGGDGDDTINGLDGADTLIANAGDDQIAGGASENDLRDLVYAGAGNDSVDGGHGNDELHGGEGNDTIAGGFGADTVIGNAGDDQLTGSALGDVIFGNDGFDFINGGFGYDRLNGGADGDRFFHLGIADHGSDWIQDYDAAQGDVLVYGGGVGAATADDFLVQRAETENAGVAGVQEAFITHIPSGNLLWALVDGDGQGAINLQIGGQVFDLLA